MPTVDWRPVDNVGSHAGGPLTHDYYKRAVYRSPPRHFNVELLPPMKIGSTYNYGLRIEPIISDSASVKSSGATVEYEIWRRWEDCLYFQDMLELQYGAIAREKRHRLAAGKGIKKNGVYIHDRAASFESLPSGPNPKSVSKDIHDYLPRLTKRGTLFRPSQATIDLRQREFTALIEAFLQEDVPTLISDLREDRIVCDFFGYWRRDHDLALKRNGKKARTTMLGGSAFSLYFSASNISLSLPTSYPDVPASIPPSPAPRSATLPHGHNHSHSGSSRRRPHTADAAVSMSDAESQARSLRPPSSAQPRMAGFRDGVLSDDEHQVTRRKAPSSASNFSSSSSGSSSALAGPSSVPGPSSAGPSTAGPSRRPTNSRGTKAPSPRSEAFDVTEDFPLFLSSSHRDVVPSSRPAAPPAPRLAQPTRGLEALPEDHELGSASAAASASEEDALLPLPTPRSRVNSNADRTNRNCIVFDETEVHDADSSSEGDVLGSSLKRLALAEVDTTGEPGLLTATSNSNSSRPSSVAMSTLSLQSRSSSWRTSASIKVPRSRPTSASSQASMLEFDFPFVSSSGTPQTPQTIEHFPIAISSIERRKNSITSSMSDYSADPVLPQRPSSPPLSPSAGAGVRRSLSSNSRLRLSQQLQSLSVPEEEVWSDLGEEFIDTYFGGAEPFFTPDDLALTPVDEPALEDPPQAPDSPSVHPATESETSYRQEISVSLSSGQFPRPFQNRPPGQFHLPWTPPVTSPLLPDASSSPKNSDDVLVVKAALDDAIVVFRARRDASLGDVRQRVYDKFALQEGIPLSSAFTLAYVPPIVVGGGGGPRASTISAGSADWARQVPIATPEEWDIAVASCGAKVVLRISQPQEY